MQHIGELITLAIIDIKEDQRREKLCLIDDIFKLRNLLIGTGYCEFNLSGKHPHGTAFDQYMELSADELTIVWAEMSAKVKRHMMKQAGFKPGTELLKP